MVGLNYIIAAKRARGIILCVNHTVPYHTVLCKSTSNLAWAFCKRRLCPRSGLPTVPFPRPGSWLWHKFSWKVFSADLFIGWPTRNAVAIAHSDCVRDFFRVKCGASPKNGAAMFYLYYTVTFMSFCHWPRRKRRWTRFALERFCITFKKVKHLWRDLWHV